MLNDRISTKSGVSAPDGLKAFSQLGLDYAYIHINRAADMKQYLLHPLRYKGYSMVLCLRGSMEIEIDTRRFTVGANTLLFVGMTQMLTVHSISDELEVSVLMMSQGFVGTLNLDINVMSSIGFDRTLTPMLAISESEMRLLKAYIDLMHYNTIENTDLIYVKSISRNLFAAAIYQVLQLASKYYGPEVQRDSTLNARALRCHNYVRDFLKLVVAHHKSERTVAFYADRLFLSGKYLSHIIKEMTGRSAAEWIDYHVIQEAKNLLRYSGKNVQQVAYELNFPNQSAFGKYFKHITGMSPTEFQRS